MQTLILILTLGCSKSKNTVEKWEKRNIDKYSHFRINWQYTENTMLYSGRSEQNCTVTLISDFRLYYCMCIHVHGVCVKAMQQLEINHHRQINPVLSRMTHLKCYTHTHIHTELPTDVALTVAEKDEVHMMGELTTMWFFRHIRQ